MPRPESDTLENCTQSLHKHPAFRVHSMSTPNGIATSAVSGVLGELAGDPLGDAFGGVPGGMAAGLLTVRLIDRESLR